MKKAVTSLMAILGFLIPDLLFAQTLLPPPRNLEADNQTLIATWQEPEAVLMQQNFEGTVFPPPNWEAASSGMGWFRAQSGSQYFIVPSHSWFAIANDDLAGPSNNGCCDLLVTPSLNLTQIVNGKLKFDSFFNGDWFQSAEVKMSNDGGFTWNTLITLTPSLSWEQLEIDLASYCGPNGFESVKFAFHSNDNWGWGSGWAIDDVKVYSDSIDVIGYNFYCNDSLIEFTESLTSSIPADMAHFGDTIVTKVNAAYSQGVSSFCSHTFISNYLPPPQNFTATSTNDSISWTWDAPVDTINLVAYIVYRDQTAIAEIEKNASIFTMAGLYPGEYCLELTSKYELSAFGYPGSFAESMKVAACDSVTVNTFLPFVEDWDSASFIPGGWTPGANWGITIMDKSTGNNYRARFSGFPLMNNYSSSLESQILSDIHPLTTTPYKVFLEFDISLTGISNNGTENFFVELFKDGEWQMLDYFRNDSSFTWHKQHYDITDLVKGQYFKFRFTAGGDGSAAIQGWFLDSIKVTREYILMPPRNLYATRKWTYPFGSILDWDPPINVGENIEFKLDDGTFENDFYFWTGGEYWIGNIFTSNIEGQLKTASVLLTNSPYGSGTIYSVDIFDENRNLVGRSDNFIPNYGQWTTVLLPDLHFGQNFYVMLHLIITSESDYLALDMNSPNSITNKSWVIINGEWNELTYFNLEPSVCAIRATGVIGQEVMSFKNYISGSNKENKHVIESCLAERKRLNIRTVEESKPKSASTEFLEPLYYNVYREVWSYFSPFDTLGWELIDTAHTCHYVDISISYWTWGKCFLITAVYPEGESLPSNRGFIYPYTETPEPHSDQVAIFPNPANNRINIILTENFNELELINSLGESKFKKTIINQKNIFLDLFDYPSGNYILIFRENEKSKVYKKLIILR
jgi:hypothetical protein